MFLKLLKNVSLNEHILFFQTNILFHFSIQINIFSITGLNKIKNTIFLPFMFNMKDAILGTIFLNILTQSDTIKNSFQRWKNSSKVSAAGIFRKKYTLNNFSGMNHFLGIRITWLNIFLIIHTKSYAFVDLTSHALIITL